jgi:hypothetical protein
MYLRVETFYATKPHSRLYNLSARCLNDIKNFPQLIEITSGRYGGTWVHPRVAIEVARWCSVKFNVQTNGLISRYTKGEVTTQPKPLHLPSKELDAQPDILSHPLPITYPGHEQTQRGRQDAWYSNGRFYSECRVRDSSGRPSTDI